MYKKIYTSLIILGSGPAGYTAAIYASRANIDTILITGPLLGGQLIYTNEIENWPGEPNHISGLDLMNRMLSHVKKFPVKIIQDTIKKVEYHKKPFKMWGEKNQYISKSIIIATGASPKYLNILSEKKYLGKGVSTCAICDGFFYKNQSVAIVGGGNTAIEEAMYLSKIAKEVHLIHRKNTFKADKILLNRIFQKEKYKNINFYYNFIVHDIIGNLNGVTEVKIKNIINNLISSIKVFGIFIAIGQTPNSEIFKKYLKIEQNYISINQKNQKFCTETNIHGIFSAGDVSDPVYQQAITASASGCMAAIDVEKYLNNHV